MTSPEPRKSTYSVVPLLVGALASCAMLYGPISCGDGGGGTATVDAPEIDGPIDAPDPAIDAPQVDAPESDGTVTDGTLVDADAADGTVIDADAAADAADAADGTVSDADAADQTLPEGGGDATDAGSCSPALVIAEVFASGGGQYRSDYVSIHNRSGAPVALAGWSLQVNDATSTATWTVVPLSGTVGAGGYYLVQLATGSTGGALPPADATGTFDLPAAGGRAAIVASTTPLTGASPSGYVDLLGYGTGTPAEGSPFSIPSGMSASRKATACTDTNANASDFFVANPLPRGSATTANVCACP